VVRIEAAAGSYLGVLTVLGALLSDRVAATGMPFAGFLAAGIVAGTVSGLLHPLVHPAVVATGALGAGILLGGVHFLALRHWRRLHPTRRHAIPSGAAQQRS
jgi:hypothetical protein